MELLALLVACLGSAGFVAAARRRTAAAEQDTGVRRVTGDLGTPAARPRFPGGPLTETARPTTRPAVPPGRPQLPTFTDMGTIAGLDAQAGQIGGAIGTAGFAVGTALGQPEVGIAVGALGKVIGGALATGNAAALSPQEINYVATGDPNKPGPMNSDTATVRRLAAVEKRDGSKVLRTADGDVRIGGDSGSAAQALAADALDGDLGDATPPLLAPPPQWPSPPLPAVVIAPLPPPTLPPPPPARPLSPRPAAGPGDSTPLTGRGRFPAVLNWEES